MNSRNKNISNSDNSTLNANNNLIEICKEFIELKNSFKKIVSLFAFLNLSDFVVGIAFVLIDITMILDGSVVGGISELCFNLMTVVVLCWIYGLPHKACRDIVKAFDTIISKTTPNRINQHLNIVLSRDTIGFRLVGQVLR